MTGLLWLAEMAWYLTAPRIRALSVRQAGIVVDVGDAMKGWTRALSNRHIGRAALQPTSADFLSSMRLRVVDINQPETDPR
jgi:hypothetical protein